MAVPTKTHFQRTSGARSWVDTFYRWAQPNGNIFYVHNSGAGGTTGGRSPEEAVTTIDAAINLTTANNGDVIVVLEGHAESITGAAGIALDIAGVSIIGMGVGQERPVITFTTADAASCDVSAADCMLKNLVFVNSRDGQTAMVNVTAADCWIEDCKFLLGDATTQAVLGILTNASASRAVFRRNFLHGSVDAGVSAGIRIVGGDAIVIEDNVIVGAFATTGCIENITTASTMLVIRRNHLLNRTADGNNVVIKLDASTTGLIVHNAGGIIDSTSPAPVTAAGMHVGGNHWSTAAGVTASVLM